MIGTVRPQSGTAKQMRLFIAEARKSSGSGSAVNLPVLLTSPSPTVPSAGGTQTAHAGQALLFLLTLLLAGMLLSQLSRRNRTR